MSDRPKVSLGIIIVNKDGQILLKKRINAHAPYYSIPGGHLELGETFEESIAREVKEETNLDITNPEVISITNNLETYRQEGKHYISVVLLAKEYSGTLENLEPEKCAELLWVDPRNLPQPHFDASAMAVECYLDKVFYKKFF